MLSYLKVLLLPKLDVVGVNRDEVIPVRPCVLVHEAESVEELVDWSHNARVETGSEIIRCDIWFRSSNSHPDLLVIQQQHNPLFQITPVLNTVLSLSEPLEL